MKNENDEERYFVVSHSEDGDWNIWTYSREKLISEVLTPDKNGSFYHGDPAEFLNAEEVQTLIDHGGVLVIKGKIAKPKSVEVVKKFEVD